MNYRLSMVIALSAFLLSISFVANQTFAANINITQYNQTLLTYANNYVQCKTNFSVSFFGYLDTLIPSANSTFSPILNTISQVAVQLQLFASRGQVNYFTQWVSGTYDPAVKSLATTFTAWRGSTTLASNTIAQLRSQYASSMTTYKACAADTSKAYVNEKVVIYQNILNTFSGQIANLSAKGVNTANLKTVLNGANTSVIIPLKQVANSGSGVNASNTQYCLFNGCQSGTNYHLDAKFGYAELYAVTAKLQATSNFTNEQSNLTEVQNYLSTVNATLMQVGSTSYTNGLNATIWSNMQSAAQLLKFVLQHP